LLFHLAVIAAYESRLVLGNEGFKITNPPWLLMKMEWKSEVGISPSVSQSARISTAKPRRNVRKHGS